jgi:hypothetical protein
MCSADHLESVGQLEPQQAVQIQLAEAPSGLFFV